MPVTELFIIRHGLAGEHGTYADDRLRPLTEDGRQKTKLVAQRLRELGLQFDRLQTSPLVRAQQTAEIVQAAGLAKAIEVTDLLAPGGSFADWLEQLGKGKWAIVGHEPDLSEWAERLLWGEPKSCLRLKKAGVIAIALPESGSPVGRSELFWLTPPRFLL